MTIIAILLVASMLISLITSYVILDFLQRKSERDLKGKRYVLFLIVGAIFIGSIGSFSYPLFRSVCVFVMIFVLGGCYFHESRKELLQDLIFAFVISLCDYLTMPFFLWFFWQMEITVYSNVILNVCLLLMSQLFLLYVYHIFRKFYFHDAYDTPLGVQLLSFLCLPLFSVWQCVMMINQSGFVINEGTFVSLLLSIAFLVFLNVYQFYSIHVISQNMQLKQELHFYEEKNRMQLQYYERLEENYAKSRKVMHDVKRHLLTLEQAIHNQEDTKAYAQDFREMMDEWVVQRYSDHRILNIILQEKSRQAKAAQIKFTCALAPVDLSFLRDIDITTIFANLLDNAMEACSYVKKDPWIALRGDQIQEFIVISIENSVSKEGKPHHEGLGLINVTQALKRYGGDIQWLSEEGVYRVNLYIPTK